MNATFEEVVKLAEQLNPEQQDLLIYRLRIKQLQECHTSSPTREELILAAKMLRQTPVRPGDSLLGKYANPNVPEMSEEEFHAQMHAIATEWKQELDEFNNDDS